MSKQRVAVLGATGSIGINTIDVVSAHPDLFEIVGLSAHSNGETLRDLGRRFSAKTALTGMAASPGVSFCGAGSVASLLEATEPDIVVNGIAGAAGLEPSFMTLEAGKRLALANKETIVMAGPLAKAAEARTGGRIIPVDSEHSAVFHLMAAVGGERVDEIILTASGGPFRDLPLEKLAGVTLEGALAHPNWKMGKKITIDSATMGNKGLEVIEALYLFGLPLASIKVIIHPQSRVHSLVRSKEGSLYAQMSEPDMRVPIFNALAYPDCLPSGFGRLELAGLSLSFVAPEAERFPMLFLAYEAASRGLGATIAYNAANEEAVAAFMDGRIRFTDIARIVEESLGFDFSGEIRDLTDVRDTDGLARRIARGTITKDNT
jgi:1-deoxy-D-xylulose-5-phosphate reductoisomerase